MKTFFSALLILLLTSCSERDEQSSSVLTPTALTARAISELEEYAATVVAATDGVVTFVSARHLMATPINTFQITFMTTHDALMSKPNAEPGNEAFYINVGRTNLWSARFCRPELKSIISRYQMDTVTGKLTDLTGDTQSMAIC